MVFIAGNKVICTNNMMFHYLCDELIRCRNNLNVEQRIKDIKTLLNVTIANAEEHSIEVIDNGTNIQIDNGDAALVVLSKGDILTREDLSEIKEVFLHCQDLLKAKHDKYFNLESVEETEPTPMEMYYEEGANANMNKNNLEPLNTHQLAMVAMYSILFDIDKQNNIYAGRCLDLDLKYKYENLESFKCFLDFLKPFVSEDNPITPDSFDILTYNYCNLYDHLDNATHELVEHLVLTQVKSNYKS